MHAVKIAGFTATLALVASLAGAQATSTPLIEHTFEENVGGWQAVGPSAKIAITNDAPHVKEGKGALQFDYALAKGDVDLLMLPTANGTLAKMKSLRFWIQSDHDAPLTLVLQEKGGGRYHADFTVSKDTWQQVELSPSDFVLSVGKDDPKDPDNTLDLDQVDSLALLDVGTFLAQSGNTDMIKLLGIPLGAHHIYIDAFTVGTSALSENVGSDNGDLLLDKFVRPQFGWLGFGGLKLSHSTDKPLDGAGLEAEYHESPGKVIGFMKSVPAGKLAGKGQIAFTAASAKPMMLVVQVEETSGGKYNTVIQIPGNSESKEFHLSFSDFKPSGDSQDDDGKLDMDQVFQVLLLDVSGMSGAVDQDNTLWFNHLRVSATK